MLALFVALHVPCSCLLYGEAWPPGVERMHLAREATLRAFNQEHSLVVVLEPKRSYPSNLLALGKASG